MKKKWGFLAIILIITCMVGWTFDQVTPAITVHASSQPNSILSSAAPAAREAVPATGAQNPVVMVVVGFIAVVFGIAAVAPLLVADQKKSF